MSRFDPVTLKILWDRVVAITDEIVASLVRTSFSINVREGYDLSCILFDARGRTLAQGTYSVPSFTGTAPRTLRTMLERFPPESLQPGDVIVTNDPWIGTGHLFDINIMRPVFKGSRLVGYTMSVTHLPDIGGSGISSTSTDVYQEGLRIPVAKLVEAGQPNALLFEMIRTNVRVADEVIGDIQANITCNEVGARALIDFMTEYGVEELETLSDAINDHSATAIAAEVAGIPDGEYRNAIDIEGVDTPIHLAARVVVKGERVSIDFDGTDGPVRASINVPMCYTRAQAFYVMKCLTIPSLPNNEGAIRPIDVSAPDGCILNVQPPWPTGGRHSVGHFIVPLLMGAFAEAVPDRVQADSSMMNIFSVKGQNRAGEGISSLFFLSGGLGAMRRLDGRATTPHPSNMTVVATEVWENLTDVTIMRRERLADTGGAGEYRGGSGQVTEFRNDTNEPLDIALMGQRTMFAARGYAGGLDGKLRSYSLNGEEVDGKGRFLLAPGDRMSMYEAGGGGVGDPKLRDPAAVLDDVAQGHVSEEAAQRHYGVRVGPAGDEDGLPA
jgi:N-methylhydantoinase B